MALAGLRANKPMLALKAEGGGADQATPDQGPGHGSAGGQRLPHSFGPKRRNRHRDRPVAEIAVRIKGDGRRSPDCRMAGQIDGIGHERGRGIRLGGRWYFDRQLSVAGGFASDTEIDGPYLSLRYDLR